MTREDIIRMARDSGFLILKFDGEDEVMEGDGNCFQTDEIESFAELVAAHILSELEYLPGRQPVQVPVAEFVEMVSEKEHLVGKPLVWAQWPNEELK